MTEGEIMYNSLKSPVEEKKVIRIWTENEFQEKSFFREENSVWE